VKAIPLKPLINLSHPLWIQLRQKLAIYFAESVSLVSPKEWNQTCMSWFNVIQDYSFRTELQYSYEEIEERLLKHGVLLFFVIVKEQPEAMVLAYPQGIEECPFYVDTIAIKQQGKGIGHVIMTTLIDWAKQEGYTSILLDTEEINEKGRNLRHFYETLGFSVIALDDEGNLTMEIKLR